MILPPNLFGLARSSLAIAALVAAFLLGGTSAQAPARAMTVELLATASGLLAVLTWKGLPPSRTALAGLAMLAGIPLVQLIPMPAPLWAGLPGRELARDISHLIAPAAWRPISLDPNATLRTLLAMCAAGGMFLATLDLTATDRARLAAAVIATALFSLLLGFAQVTTASTALNPFLSSHSQFPIGLFANRNHQAALLYSGAILAIALAQAPGQDAVRRVACFGLSALFAAGIFATGSRAGVAILAISVALSFPLLFRPRFSPARAAQGAIGLAVVAALASRSGVVQDALARFAQQSSDQRYEFWPEVVYSIRTFFPIGSGLGTFARSYQMTESLGTVGTHYINHAHNDYLEIALETGIVGIFCIFLFIAWLAFRSWAVLKESRLDLSGLLSRAAIILVLAFLLHSLVDYPLRTYAHLIFFGCLCGLLFPARDAVLTANGENATHAAFRQGRATNRSPQVGGFASSDFARRVVAFRKVGGSEARGG